jgi:hypothetical protein
MGETLNAHSVVGIRQIARESLVVADEQPLASG